MMNFEAPGSHFWHPRCHVNREVRSSSRYFFTHWGEWQGLPALTNKSFPYSGLPIEVTGKLLAELLYLFIPQIFSDGLLDARHYSPPWGYSGAQDLYISLKTAEKPQGFEHVTSAPFASMYILHSLG